MTITQKAITHSIGFPRAVLNMVIISTFCFFVSFMYAHSFQALTPTSVWYQYDEANPVMPVTDSIDQNEYMSFISNSSQNKPMKMEWYDTLFCELDSGVITEVATQYWVKYENPFEKNKHSWEWKKEKFQSNYVRCNMRGVIVGTTSLGYKKTDNYQSPWWYVTR